MLTPHERAIRLQRQIYTALAHHSAPATAGAISRLIGRSYTDTAPALTAMILVGTIATADVRGRAGFARACKHYTVAGPWVDPPPPELPPAPPPELRRHYAAFAKALAVAADRARDAAAAYAAAERAHAALTARHEEA